MLNQHRKKIAMLSALLAATSFSVFATDNQPSDTQNITNIIINNVQEDKGLELGTNARARGTSSIATGSGSLALGNNAVATGGNETKDTIKAKLNENKQKLQEIADAEKRTNTLLNDLQNIRKTEADVIEAGERVKQVRKAKVTAYDVWQQKEKAYNDEVANSANFLKENQAKIDDLNSRLQGVSQLQNVNISSDEGLTNAATQLKSIAEQGTTLNLSVDFYKDYVSSYYRALGDLRQNQMTYKNKIYSSGFYGKYSGTLLENIKNPYDGLSLVDDIKNGINFSDGSNGLSFYSSNLNKSAISFDATIPAPEYSIFFRDIDLDVIPVEEWDRVQVAAPQFKKAFAIYFNNTNDPFLSDEAKQTVIAKFNKKVDYFVKLNEITYYQGKYEETKDTRWLDRKAVALNEMTALKKEFDSLKSVCDMRIDAINSWKKENIDDVLSKNKITTDTLTSELQKALGINKDAIKQKEAEIEALKKAAEQAKNTYDNTNPSEADLALSQRYEEIMRQLTAKANELKASQERLQALKEALTLNDLTDVGENAMAIGTNALTTGSNAIGIGTDVIVTGEDAIAIGHGSSVTGEKSIAIGTGHIVIGDNAGTFGDPNTIYGDNSYGIGNNITIGSSTTTHTVGTNTFVLGNNVNTTANNAVILGADSTGMDNTVSVGSKGNERKIINVGQGEVSKTSTDAINGSQLQGVKDDLLTEINKKGAAVKVINGTNITVSSETKDGTTTYTINAIGNGKVEKGNTGLVTGDTVFNSIQNINNSITNKADTDLSNITDDGKTVIRNLAKGSVKVINGTNTTVTVGTDGDATTYAVNVSNDAIKGAIQPELDKKANTDASNLSVTDITKWQEKLGTGSITEGNTGLVSGDTIYQYTKNLTIGNNPLAVTYDNSDRSTIILQGENGTVITNLKNGELSPTSTDAVTGNQLYATNERITSNQQSINQLKGEIGDVGAMAGALAALHPVDSDAKLSFSAGYGNYRGKNAAAIGAFYRPSEDVLFNVASTVTDHDNIFNAGVSFKVGSVPKRVKVDANEFNDMKKQLGDLQQLVSKLMDGNNHKPLKHERKGFKDVPHDHWAAEAVETLHANDIVHGYPDGEFKGDKNMTRYEYAQMLYNNEERQDNEDATHGN